LLIRDGWDIRLYQPVSTKNPAFLDIFVLVEVHREVSATETLK